MPLTSTKYCINLHRSHFVVHNHYSLQGKVLKPLQRMGQLGKRSGNNMPQDADIMKGMKGPKYMYLSIDEAASHVNVRHFRCTHAAHCLMCYRAHNKSAC